MIYMTGQDYDERNFLINDLIGKNVIANKNTDSKLYKMENQIHLFQGKNDVRLIDKKYNLVIFLYKFSHKDRSCLEISISNFFDNCSYRTILAVQLETILSKADLKIVKKIGKNLKVLCTVFVVNKNRFVCRWCGRYSDTPDLCSPYCASLGTEPWHRNCHLCFKCLKITTVRFNTNYRIHNEINICKNKKCSEYGKEYGKNIPINHDELKQKIRKHIAWDKKNKSKKLKQKDYIDIKFKIKFF